MHGQKLQNLWFRKKRKENEPENKEESLKRELICVVDKVTKRIGD